MADTGEQVRAADDARRFAAQAQCGGEQAIDDQDALVDAAVHDLRLALGADDEDHGHFALHDAARELVIDAAR